MDRVATWLALDLPKYWKAVIAAVPVVIFVGTEVVQSISNESKDGTFTTEDGFRILLVAITAFCVYQKRNRPMTPRPPKPRKPAKKRGIKKAAKKIVGRHRRREPAR